MLESPVHSDLRADIFSFALAPSTLQSSDSTMVNASLLISPRSPSSVVLALDRDTREERVDSSTTVAEERVVATANLLLEGQMSTKNYEKG